MAKPKFAKGNKAARGGKRPGAGRKSSAVKRVLKRVQADHAADAEYCFNFMVRVVKGRVKANTTDQIHAAIYVCNRVWGSPTQAITLPDGPLVRIILPPPATEPPPGVGPKRA